MQLMRLVGIVALLSVLTVGGCPPPGPNDDSNEPAPDPNATIEPDIAAISTVVKTLYGIHGRGRIIFLGSDDDGVDNELLTQAGSAVQEELGVRVLPESAADRSDPNLPVLTPKDPETGELGVTIQLGRFRSDADDRLAVSAWAIRSGLDAQEYDIILERSGDGWVIVQMEEGAVA